MSIESHANNKDDANGNSKKEPIHYKQLVNYIPDEIIQLFQTKGVVVECHACKYSYTDRQQRNYFTYDYSICPNCKAFNILINKNSTAVKKKHSISMEREYTDANSAVPFLTRKDISNDVKTEITLTFDGKEDAIRFLALLDGKVNSKSIRVFVTTH